MPRLAFRRGMAPAKFAAFTTLLAWYSQDWSGTCGHAHPAANAALKDQPQFGMMPLLSVAADLSERIRKSTEQASKEVDALTRKQVMDMQREMATAREEIGKTIKDFDHNPKFNTPAKRKRGMAGLQKDIDKSIDQAFARQAKLVEAQTKAAIDNGLFWGVQDVVDQKAPGGWGDLTKKQVGELATNARGIISTEGLQFLSAYRLELAGDVANEIKQKIKGTLATSMISGDPLYETVRKLGHVPIDPEKFRHAGGRVFPSAANRMQLIAATENNRVHNMGKLAFHEKIGVREVTWLTSEKDNVCGICLPRHGVTYKIKDLPGLPAHPGCCCTIIPEASSIDMTPEAFLEAA